MGPQRVRDRVRGHAGAAGRLADRTSRKGGFLVGLAIFTVASACCALADNVATLVALRAVQAVGAALLVPTSLSLVLAAYPAERRGGAVRVWTAMGGLAAGLGPVLGGLLVTIDWRWVFLVNVPIGLAALAFGWRSLPNTPGERGPFPDAMGALLLTAGIGALTLGLVKGNDWGWTSSRVIGLLVGAGVASAVFLLRCARHPSPVLELGLLRIRSFGVTLAAALLFSAAFGAGLLSLVLWLQDNWGWSALRTGLGVAPGPLTVPLVTILAGVLIRRIGPGPVIAVGCTVYAAGQLLYVAVVGLRPDYPLLLCGLLTTGVGVGLTLPTLFSTAAGALPPHRFATGSAVLSMVRQLGFAVGVAVLVAVLGAPLTATGRLDAFDRGWTTIAGIAFVGGLVALLIRRTGRTPSSSTTTAASRRVAPSEAAVHEEVNQ